MEIGGGFVLQAMLYLKKNLFDNGIICFYLQVNNVNFACHGLVSVQSCMQRKKLISHW